MAQRETLGATTDTKEFPANASPAAPIVTGALRAPKIGFKVGDKAAYPGQGVIEVTAIEERDIAGTRQTCYILRAIGGIKRTIILPVETAETSGLRPLLSEQEVCEIFEIFRDRTYSFSNEAWHRNFKNLKFKLATGSAYDVAEVLRDFYRKKNAKGLSIAEQLEFDRARKLIIQELAIAGGQPEEQVIAQIEAIFPVYITQPRIYVADLKDRKISTHRKIAAAAGVKSKPAPKPKDIQTEVRYKTTSTPSGICATVQADIANFTKEPTPEEARLIASLRVRKQARTILIVTKVQPDLSGLINGILGTAEEISTLIAEGLLRKLQGNEYRLTPRSESIIDHLL